METGLLLGFFKLIVALVVVIGLAYLSLKLGKTYMDGLGSGKNVKVLETVPVHSKAYISIVKIGEDYMAIGISEGKMDVIKSFSEEEGRALAEKTLANRNNTQFITVKEWIGTLKNDAKKSKK